MGTPFVFVVPFQGTGGFGVQDPRVPKNGTLGCGVEPRCGSCLQIILVNLLKTISCPIQNSPRVQQEMWVKISLRRATPQASRGERLTIIVREAPPLEEAHAARAGRPLLAAGAAINQARNC